MELCIVLNQRLLAFASSYEACKLAQRSIQCARQATLGWIARLREELRNAKDDSTADRAAAYAFKSALLCRRTFAATSNQLTAEELEAYCEASTALQEHMTTGFESDPVLKMMVIQDTKMDIGATVYASMQDHPESLGSAIMKSWSKSGDAPDTAFSSWTAIEGEEPWVVARTTTTGPAAKYAFSLTVHFNYVSGFLLVNGKPAGRLPERIRRSEEVKELFGDHAHLRTYPCDLDGTGWLTFGLVNVHEASGRLFSHFERPEFLKIFFSPRQKLCVDLGRFELAFHANRYGRLEETKLGKEFDPNQDAGTFRGLLSMLVLRDVVDTRRWTIIVPLGKSVYRLNNPHVETSIIPSGANAYAKYEIDDVLGRLTCPPEPALLASSHPSYKLTCQSLMDLDARWPERGSALTWAPIIGGFQSGAAPSHGLGKLVEDSVVEQFGELVDFSRRSSPDRLYSLAFRLALLSFKQKTDLDLLEVLAAIARLDSLKILVPPQHPVFVDFDLIAPSAEHFETLIQSTWPPFAQRPGKNKKNMEYRDQHLMRCEEEGRRLAKWFVKQWPCQSPSLDGFQSGTNLIDGTDALDSVLEVWQRKMNNIELGGYIDEIQEVLDKFAAEGNGLLQDSQPRVFPATVPFPSIFVAQDQWFRLFLLSSSEIPPTLSRIGIAALLIAINEALAKDDKRSLWLRMANLWPGGKVTLLEQLRSTAKSRFGAGMKEALVRFGVMNTELQWLERLRHHYLNRDVAKVQEALRDAGHQNWDPLQRPDWLLMELECKSSCIVPMAIATLADTTQIARLVVPKALLLQSAQVVQSRIGGLVGREIRHIPFSRRTPSTDEILSLYMDLHKEIRQESGVLLTTSDHILSFKLSGLQRLVDSKTSEAEKMIRFQETLTRLSRDVIDESDFTLAVKTQLIYPSGPQLSVDGAPHRWQIIQELLGLFEDHLPDLRRAFPASVEVVPRSQAQAFPMAFLLRKDAEDEFHRLIIEDIVNNRTSFLRLFESGVPPKKDKDGLKEVVNLFADQESAAKTLLLVRGLILNRILLFCMKRRFNVQYGLHTERDPMAVPFEAKGVPSESSEFGHPDVAIIFTTLSFYYAGLTLAQFRQSLSSVLKADDAASAYDRWTHGCDTLPAGLRHWNVINCDDDGQVEELYSHLRHDRNVLNSYLNSWVFPLYAKQFGLKLSASAWDLPNFSRPQKPTLPGARSTGFSGTNDNKSLLPLTIHQDDLPSLVQTNAEVLSYLLQPRNRRYHCAAYHGTRMTEEQLLHKIFKEGMMVLIDAGAYILELSNQALVSKWLEINTMAKAGVFFKSDNRAWVLYRGVKKKTVPLVATPFADNLTECVVFLDEAHCRGTDLKLPRTAKGALTLALGQTKDHTVQGRHIPLEAAHLIPVSQTAWFNRNHMKVFQGHLVFVPRVHRGGGTDGIATYSNGRLDAEAVALVCYTLKPDPSYELVHLYHLHPLEPLEDIPAEYIFSNFAYAIFRICEFFDNDGRRRKCVQLEEEVGQEPQYKIRDNPVRKDSGTLSRSPTKRRGTSHSSPEKRARSNNEDGSDGEDALIDCSFSSEATSGEGSHREEDEAPRGRTLKRKRILQLTRSPSWSDLNTYGVSWVVTEEPFPVI
ncbi:hypothetical protein F5883DRAFT_703262 [Diaporthe sp. PMI_573]|nr:hypothetical protein F5883DRAFT_703262 [Diaporthaceae sp. PMI_573]